MSVQPVPNSQLLDRPLFRWMEEVRRQLNQTLSDVASGSVIIDTTDFNNNLSALDSTVQIALETIDDLDLGEDNTASNLGAGAGVFKVKTGVNLDLRSLVAQGGLVVTQQTNTIDIDLPSQATHSGKYLTTNGTTASWGTVSVPVTSVFGRTGAVVAVSGDYTSDLITNDSIVVAGATVTEALDALVDYVDSLPQGAVGDIQYNDGSGWLAAEAGLNYAAATNTLKVTAAATTDVMLKLKMAASHTGNPFQLLSSADALVSFMTDDGDLILGTTAQHQSAVLEIRCTGSDVGLLLNTDFPAYTGNHIELRDDGTGSSIWTMDKNANIIATPALKSRAFSVVNTNYTGVNPDDTALLYFGLTVTNVGTARTHNGFEGEVTCTWGSGTQSNAVNGGKASVRSSITGGSLATINGFSGQSFMNSNSNLTNCNIINAFHTSVSAKTGTITNLRAFYSAPHVFEDSVITSYAAFWADLPTKDTGTITTAYQYYAVEQTVGTTNWQFYSVDGESYHNGRIIQTATNKKIVSKTTTYTATVDDYTILGDATGAAFTITLPTAAAAYNSTAGSGLVLCFVKTDSSINAVTVDGNGSETINGATTQVLALQWDHIMIQSNGTSWFIIA